MDHVNELLSDDEEYLPILDRIYRERRPKTVNIRVNHFQKWDETDFFRRFRVHKETANYILELISEEISSPTRRNNALLPQDKLLTTLRYYASGTFLINVGDLSGVHVSTTSKVVRQVSRALARKCSDFITLPQNGEEIQVIKSGFYKISRFPRCIGALDCTHVKLQSPGGDNAEAFRNRRGVFSMNVQCMCDSKLVINNIVARWPGSTHDSHIFNNSNLCARLEAGNYGDGLVVADSGYGLTPNVITPLANPQTEAESLFQEAQIRTRNPIERCFGLWKRRFPALSMGIRLNIQSVQAIIVATAVLHNIATVRGEDVPEVTEEELEAINFLNDVPVPPAPNLNPQAVTRNVLINYFDGLLLH